MRGHHVAPRETTAGRVDPLALSNGENLVSPLALMHPTLVGKSTCAPNDSLARVKVQAPLSAIGWRGWWWVTVCSVVFCLKCKCYLNVYCLARLPFSWSLSYRERTFVLLSSMGSSCLSWIEKVRVEKARFIPEIEKHFSFSSRNICLQSILPKLTWIV